MTTAPLLTVALADETDIAMARQRARQIAALLGFEGQDQVRIATAVSEIARNAASYAVGGRVEFAAVMAPEPGMQVVVRDKGPGIPALADVLAGRFTSRNGMGLGLSGTRRLMDGFEISSGAEGTVVCLRKRLPRDAAVPGPATVAAVGRALLQAGTADPLNEARLQNQELLRSLDDLQSRQEEARRLNAELEHTNRGVVALYAELDEKNAALEALNAGLEARVAAAVAECQHANDALRQSQKMEAVGQLTGGIAHDFNNLLQIVLGNLELLGRRLPADSERLRRATDNAMFGAQRAALLTQRLLAFSRRQPLAPRPVDANRLVDGMSDLVRRTLSETVSTVLALQPGLWLVEVDANQLENAVLNLAVNARDATPPGGTLLISTANTAVPPGDPEVAAGEYVAIAVQDTGSGMSDDTKARVLEPFFTTKGPGKGTGLGLSMVYGFITQSGGHLRIDTALGRGTTVTLCLPRFHGVLAEPEPAPAAPACAAGAGAGETILVVEDDAGVRTQTCDSLSELGYGVLAVSDGPSAVAVLNGQARIDLVLTDVVLAGAMTGRDVAAHAARARPGLPVLYASGYARDVVGREVVGPDVDLLAKPFTFAELARRVGAALRGRG